MWPRNTRSGLMSSEHGMQASPSLSERQPWSRYSLISSETEYWLLSALQRGKCCILREMINLYDFYTGCIIILHSTICTEISIVRGNMLPHAMGISFPDRWHGVFMRLSVLITATVPNRLSVCPLKYQILFLFNGYDSKKTQEFLLSRTIRRDRLRNTELSLSRCIVSR